MEKGQEDAYIETSYYTSDKRKEENEDDIRFVRTLNNVYGDVDRRLNFVLPELPTPPKKSNSFKVSVFLRTLV